MSKTVDERVVEMRFDNAQFERNVQTSMSTLDKLKQKLNLSGAAKGLNDIDTAAKKVDMNGLSSGIETVSAKFSALQVMGATALANITNSAVNAGKRMVSALTLDPVMSGYQEYETQMNAIQTILANTQKEGTNVKVVNKALDELNTYADKTIYNFTEMTRNIGTFTAAGVKLDTSVSAIKGIANLAAVSGSNSQQASTAMYQLSQAIATGTVRLMDWNSVVNAGMGGQVFQDALVRTSEHLQTGAKAAISAKGSFRESLQTGWLTTEVLTQTLDQFATAADTQEEYEAAVKKFVEQGYTQEEAKQMADMAKTAGEAATKVKTFSQLIDTLKEALGSGWAQTWRLIIGDFEESKSLWTSISDVLGGFINKISDTRNKVLESALGKGFTSLSKKISDVIEPAKKVTGTISETVDKVSKLGDVVDDVISGKFGNGTDHFNALSEAGQNYYKVQNKVNESLGNSFRYTDEQIAAQDKLLGKTSESTDATKEETTATAKLTDEKKELIKKIASMTEEQMRSKGYTEEQIEAFKELGETADKLGMPLDEFIDNMDQITGRWLLINSFKNIGQSIINVFKAIGDAWRETFEPISGDDLFNIIAGFHKFTMTIKLTDEDVDKLKRTFKGLFAILDIITTIAGGGMKIAFKALSAILSTFDMDILDLTANIGDAIVKFRDFLFNNDLIAKGFELLGEGVKMAADAFKELYNTIKGIPKVQEFIENIKNIDLTEIGKNVIEGFKKGLKDGLTSIPQILIEIGSKLLAAIKDVLGIHSPSREMYDVGKNTVEGLNNGIKDGASKVWKTISDLGSKLVEWFKNIDWNTVFAGGVSIALLLAVKKLIGIIDNITAPLAGLGDLLSGVGNVLNESAKSVKKILNNTAKVVKGFAKILNAQAFKMKAAAIKDLAISLAILAGAVFILAQLDTGALWGAVGAITVLAAVLVGLAFAMDQLTSVSASVDKNGFNLKGLRIGLVGIGMTLLMIAATVKIMGTMNPDKMKQGFIGLAGLIVAIAVVFASFGLLVKGKSAQNIDKAGKMIRKMAVTLLLLVAVVKLVGMLSTEEMIKGASFAGAFLVFVTALNAASLLAGRNIDKLGKAIVKISIAMTLMIGVCKLAGQLSKEEMINGAAFAGAFLVFVRMLLAITKIDKGSELSKLGGMLLSMSISMMLMVGVCKLVNKLSPEEMLKGALFAAGFLVFVKTLVSVTKIGKEEQIAKVAGTILAASVAIGIMAGVCILLGLIDTKALAKGVVAVGMFGALLALMIYATKDAQDCKGNIIAMSIAIAVMATAVAALSFIDPIKLAGATTALSILMGMFALIAKAANSMQGVIGSLIVMTVAVGLLAGIIYLLSKLPIDSVLASSASLSMLLLSLSAAMFTIGKMGTVAPTALIAIGVMTLVTAALAGILYMISGLPIESTLATASALSMLLLSLSASCAILAVVGMAGPAALIGVASLLTLVVAIGGLIIAIGALTTYFPQLEEFLNKGMPILEKIGYSLGSFVGNIVNGFANGIADGLPAIGFKLSLFMTALQLFLTGASSIDPSILEGVKALSKAILYLTAADVIQGISSWLTGGNSLVDFANQLKPFGEGLKAYADSVSGIDSASILNSAKAAKALVSVANTLPNEGGLLSKITGDNDLGEFAKKLKPFGEGLKDYANAVAGIEDISAISESAKAANALIGIAKLVPNEGGLLSKITGDNDLGTFASKLKPFGEGLKDYTNAVAGIDTGSVSTSISTAKSIISLIKSTSGIDTSGVALFTTAVNKLAKTNISGFIKAFDSAASKLESSGEKMMTSLAKGMENKKSSVTQKVEVIANAVQKAIKDEASKFETAGESLIKKLASGMKNQKSKVSDAATDGLKDAVSDIKGYYDDFYDAGGYLVKGFANGINNNTFRSTAKAKAMAKKAYKAAKEALDINSPSKIFRRLGKAVPEGFAQGIDRLGNVVENSSVSMARTAIGGTKDAIAHMARIVDGDIDAQPTIRPVVDLSDVQYGVGALNGMFANELSIGANVDAKAISLMMNRNRQNGSNDDVISAINKLGNNIDNISRPSYTVEGITYDSGSEISAAIETLISAAIRERRV